MHLQSNLAHVPPPVSLLAPQAAIMIAARTCLLEGPAFDSTGNLFFSDIIGNHIYRLHLTARSPSTELTVDEPMAIPLTLMDASSVVRVQNLDLVAVGALSVPI